MTTNKFGLFATSIVLITSLICATTHWFLLTSGKLSANFAKSPLPLIYFFLVSMSLLAIWFVLWRYKKDHTAAGRAYFITVFFKMFGSAFFLYPDVLIKADILRETALQFMILFFILLFIETFLLVRLLNKPLDEKLKNDENQ